MDTSLQTRKRLSRVPLKHHPNAWEMLERVSLGVKELEDNPRWLALRELADRDLDYIALTALEQDEPWPWDQRYDHKAWLRRQRRLRARYDAIIEQLHHYHFGRMVDLVHPHVPELPVTDVRWIVLLRLLIGAEARAKEAYPRVSWWGLTFFGDVTGRRPRVGRPCKPASAMPQPTRPSPRLDPEMSQRAYDLHADGWHWTKIAQHLWPDTSLNSLTPNKREALRKKVDRLCHRGSILAQS